MPGNELSKTLKAIIDRRFGYCCNSLKNAIEKIISKVISRMVGDHKVNLHT